MKPKIDLSQSKGPELNKEETTRFRRIVGSLQSLTTTQPNITYAVLPSTKYQNFSPSQQPYTGKLFRGLWHMFFTIHMQVFISVWWPQANSSHTKTQTGDGWFIGFKESRWVHHILRRKSDGNLRSNLQALDPRRKWNTRFLQMTRSKFFS